MLITCATDDENWNPDHMLNKLKQQMQAEQDAADDVPDAAK